VSNAALREGRRQVTQLLVGDVLESSADHFLETNLLEGLHPVLVLLASQACELAEVTNVDTALVKGAGKAGAVHRETGLAFLQIAEETGDDIGSEVVADLAHISLVFLVGCLLLVVLRELAREDIGVESEREARDIDRLLLLGLLLAVLGFAILLLCALLLGLLGLTLLLEHLRDVLPKLGDAVRVDKLRTEDSHAVRVALVL
jgi:hypothetical protein